MWQRVESLEKRMDFRTSGFLLSILSIVFLPLSTGCGSSEYPLAPVSGVVTLDGRPLEGARISFQPRASGGKLHAGPPSYGETDADGRFSLHTFYGNDGAVVANHRVCISTEKAKPNPDGSDNIIILAEERLPARYHNRSKLEFTVQESGTDQCNFDLTSDNEKHSTPSRGKRRKGH